MGLLKRIFWSAPSGSDQAEAGPSSERIQQDNSNTAREPDDEPMLMDTAPAKSSPAAPVRGESRTSHAMATHSSSQPQLSQGGTPRSGPAESQVQRREEPAPRAPVAQSDPRPSSSSSHTIPENLWAPSLDPRARPRLKGAKVMFVEDDQDLLKPDARKEPTKIRKLKPRKYQLALYEQAKSHNIIACLDTGAGKTLVAVMLLQYFNEVELVRTSSQSVSEARTAAFPQVETPLRRIGLFLVTRVPLVDQQAKVIVNNSNLEVTRFSGSDAHQSGTRNAWDTVRRRSDVAVATAQVVLTALMHGFLRMEDIYCIVFDEAHHAFGDEPYAGIMKFYEQYVKKPVPDQPLPRIFGMTASPLKKLGGDEARTSERLESIMKAHILTAPVIHRAELALAVNKPIECIVEYEPPTFFEDSILTKSIREKSHAAKDLLPVLERIEFHTKEHGPLFADIIWATSVNELKKQTATQSALTMINTEWLLEKQSATENRRGQLTSNSRNARLIDDEVRRTFELPDTLTLTNEHVTPKILKLMKILMCFCATEESREGLRGIIFVERRDTAYALHELVRRQENLRWLKTGYVIGHGDGGEAIGLKQGHTSQEAVLSRFRSGEFNLLIATSVIEEGIDVSPCNLIIRFDLFTNHVGFIQSKGRARHKQSKFIMMAERGSEQHYRLIKEVADTDRALRGWLTDLPDDRIHDVRFMAEKDDPDGDLVLEVEETGARLYVQQAVMLLATVHASLVTVDSACHAAQYKSEQLPNCEGFRCTITLPENWKIPDIVSDVRASKKAAKRLAAFRACEALHKAGKLNAFLRPSASIAKSRKRGMLPLAPTRLQEGVQVQVQQLQSYRGLKLGFDEESNTWKVHATLVRLDKIPQNALNGPCRMMIVLTVDPVSATSEFRLRFTTTDHTFAGLPASSPLTLDSERMEAFRRYTMRLLRWVGRQPQWYCDDMPYILVPATMNAGNARVFDFEKHVDMEEVTRLGQWFTKKVLESGMDVSLGQFYDRILLEKDYEIGAVAYAVTGVTRYKEEYGELERQRSKRRTESGRSKATWKSGIPNVPDEALGMNWFTVSRIERMQNWATGHLEDSTGPKFYHATALPPTNVWVHAISASVYRSGLVMPVILDRIHQALCAQRCNEEIFQGMVGTSHLIEALTVPTAAYSFNYERLEFIGDTFLKLLATAYVFAENIESQEGLRV
ncbi:unnamed protein product [Tilletia controversa]|nr:unnamed protein product [Tilletia controversa]